jgi:NAD(P)-dependent dehydrogenase (short-subunit alcohol dehydrogenase family)
MGRVIAARLADEGCHVAGFDVRDTPEAVELRAGRAIQFYTADVSNRTVLEDAVGRVESDLDSPDVLVNTAAVLSRAPFLELTDAQWDQVMAVNLRGTFLACQVVARAMVRSGKRGRIVNISSNSQVMAAPLAAHYAATKGGVFSLTRTIALELAPHGITVNLVCPGPILTDMNREAFADPAYRAQRERSVPIGRLGQPEDVARAVAFLTADTSEFITGATLFVDGGQTLGTAV